VSLTKEWGVARILFIVLGVVVALTAFDLIRLFVVAGILAYLADPLVDRLQDRMGGRRGPAVLVVVLLVLAPIGLAIWRFVPLVAVDSEQLAANGPELFAGTLATVLGGRQVVLAGQLIDVDVVANQIIEHSRGVAGSPTEAAHLVAGTIEGLLHALLSVVAVVYFLLDPGQVGRFALSFVPTEHRPRTLRIAREIDVVLHRFLIGQLQLIALMSLLTYLGLALIFHLPYAVPIAIFSGVVEIVPLLGPLTAGGIASIVALQNGGLSAAVGVVILYLVLRQLEDNLVMPLVFKHAAHLHPVATIAAVLIAGRFLGVLGLLLAIPTIAVLNVLRVEFLDPPKDENAPEPHTPVRAVAEPWRRRLAWISRSRA